MIDKVSVSYISLVKHRYKAYLQGFGIFYTILLSTEWVSRSLAPFFRPYVAQTPGEESITLMCPI